MTDEVKDAVDRVQKFFDGFIPHEKIHNPGPLPRDRSSLDVDDVRTVLQALADAKAENERLQKDADMLRDCVMEFRNYAMSGKSFNYPLGSLQRIEHALKGTNP